MRFALAFLALLLPGCLGQSDAPREPIVVLDETWQSNGIHAMDFTTEIRGTLELNVTRLAGGFSASVMTYEEEDWYLAGRDVPKLAHIPEGDFRGTEPVRDATLPQEPGRYAAGTTCSPPGSACAARVVVTLYP